MKIKEYCAFKWAALIDMAFHKCMLERNHEIEHKCICGVKEDIWEDHPDPEEYQAAADARRESMEDR